MPLAFRNVISRSFVASHRKVVRDAAILLATLDRIAIGPILRSNLVFLINVCCNAHAFLVNVRDAERILPRMCGH